MRLLPFAIITAVLLGTAPAFSQSAYDAGEPLNARTVINRVPAPGDKSSGSNGGER